MDAYRTYRLEATVEQNGLLILTDLPLQAGKRVEVIILVEQTEDSTEPPARQPRKAGSAAGQIWMSDDFDAPLEGFKEYMNRLPNPD